MNRKDNAMDAQVIHPGYYPFENEGETYGSFELVYWSYETIKNNDMRDEESNLYTPGWYWQSCFPGCLPDSNPIGPFRTASEAYDDAKSNA
jgi:hypothetical protein